MSDAPQGLDLEQAVWMQNFWALSNSSRNIIA